MHPMSEITTLVCDWGDTLMKVFPQYDGVMAEWPEVAVIDGVPETLQQLSGQYRLVVATNAAGSNVDQIRRALERVGISNYIDEIYNYKVLGSRKPDPAFFLALQAAEGARPGTLVMVGDEYNADITGPFQAGWPTVWLNPSRKAAPGLLPLQTAEIRRFADLPAALERLDLPGVSTCLAWMAQEGTPSNLLAHIQLVASIAYQMALWLELAGERVDPLLAHRGGLLHDLAKVAPARPGEADIDHGLRAAQMLNSRQQPALAEIAARHLLPRIMDAEAGPKTWEQKMVYFADKLVEGGRIVPVEERMEALEKRYPQHAEGTRAAAPAILALQEELCRAMGVPVEELIARLEQALRGGGEIKLFTSRPD